jgi:hypothetical protein
MQSTIHTKWHRLRELIDADEVYLTAPKGGKAQHISEFGGDLPYIQGLITQFDNLPKFVVDPELQTIVRKGEFHKSMLDMKRAGVMRLPFPVMIVELPSIMRSSTQSIVVLRDLADKANWPWEQNPELEFIDGVPAEFYGLVFRVLKDEDGEYAVFGSTVIKMAIEEKDGDPWLRLSGSGYELCPSSEKFEQLVKATYQKDAAEVFQALASALLLMSTAGVTKEVIEVTRLNRKREEANKIPIPKHTFIKIGHVYKHAAGDEKEEYVPRRSPRPHWRRGHNRHVHFGPKFSQIKLKFIPARLVAFHGDTDPAEPSQKHDYIVTN